MTEPARSLHVAVAAIVSEDGRVLISRRPKRVHQGGLWEFPGGKVEPGEDTAAALARELQEELAITPTRTAPLVQVHHDYPDLSVFLDVLVVSSFEGEPHGVEDQPLRWATAAELDTLDFPAANQPILDAVKGLLEERESLDGNSGVAG
jgi:8-oxo-dGTP diphosphatase